MVVKGIYTHIAHMLILFGNLPSFFGVLWLVLKKLVRLLFPRTGLVQSVKYSCARASRLKSNAGTVPHGRGHTLPALTAIHGENHWSRLGKKN